MIKTDRVREIKPAWLQITAASLPTWDERGRIEPFQPDSRRGHARVKPEAMTSARIPSQPMLELDKHPTQGLGFYNKSESTEHFSSYKWSGWTRKEVQTMQVDQGLMECFDLQVKLALVASAQPLVCQPRCENARVRQQGEREAYLNL